MADIVPLQMTPVAAQRKIRELAANSANVIVISHGVKRQRERKITRRQIELCALKGVIVEGPFLNQHGNWQVTIQRMAAGEEVMCVIAIDWPNKLIVITAYR